MTGGQRGPQLCDRKSRSVTDFENLGIGNGCQDLSDPQVAFNVRGLAGHDPSGDPAEYSFRVLEVGDYAFFDHWVSFRVSSSERISLKVWVAAANRSSSNRSKTGPSNRSSSLKMDWMSSAPKGVRAMSGERLCAGFGVERTMSRLYSSFTIV